MPRSTDKLAFALAAPEPVSRSYFRNVFDHLYVTDAVQAGYSLDAVDQHRRATQANLEALAVCDFEFGERQTVHSCPPLLSLLPHAGFPVAVLSGARTPALLRQLKVTVRGHRQSAALSVTGQPSFPLLPNRVRVQAKDLPTLRAIAQEVGVSFLEIPLSWLLLAYSCSVEAYANALPWSAGEADLNWRRDDFNPSTLTFYGVMSGKQLRLTRFKHPQQAHLRRYYLVAGGRSAEVEPTWARYYVLHRFQANVLQYDERLACLLLPLYCPLPRLLNRALTACSGLVGQTAETPDGQTHRAFMQVPRGYADVLARKLGQPLMAASLPKAPRDVYD